MKHAQRFLPLTIAPIVALMMWLVPYLSKAASPTSFDWGTFDSTGATTQGVLDSDNTTILQEGDIAQFIWAGPDGTIDPPQTDGTPGDDDVLLDSSTILNGAPLPPPAQNEGYITLKTYSFDTDDPQSSGVVYIRAWNDSNIANATHYGDSATATLTALGSYNANRWHTDTPKPVIVTPGVDLSPETASASGDPSTTVNYSLQLTNTGNVADTFTVTVGSGNSWTTNVSSDTVPLNPGISTTINVAVTIPAGTAATTSDMATITATSGLSSVVSDTTSLTTTANQVANVDVTSPNATQTGIASTTVTYPVQVTNTGNGNDTFTLNVGNNNWPTTLSVTPTVSLNAGASTTITASVEIPVSASTGMTDMAIITATSTTDNSVNDTTTLTTSATAAAPNVDLGPDMAKSGTVGTTISYMVPVTNTGNVVDTFTVTVAAGNSWTATLNAPTVGPLNPGDSGMAIVSVSVPSDAQDGTTDTATIIATSMFSPTVSDSSDLTTTASVIPMPNVELSPETASASGDPNTTVNYSVQVTNTGNVADTFAVTVATGNSWTTTPSPTSVSLGAGASTTINVSVMIPAGTAAGTSDTATIIATSALSSTVSDGSNLTTTANQVANVDTSPNATQTGIASTTVTYPVQVTNTGNGNDTFTLMVGNNSWPTTLSSASVGPLAAGQSMTVTASVEIPVSASTGMTDMAIITATSNTDNSVNDTTTLTTSATAAAPNVDLGPDMAKSGTVGTTITYMVPVTNTGNVMDTFTVTVAAGNSWSTSLNASTVGPLNPGDSGMAIVSVMIPANILSGTIDTATVVATSMFSPTVSDSSDLTTTASVIPMPNVDFSADMAASGDPGSTVNYSLQVTNSGNVADTFAVTVATGNSWTTTPSPTSVSLGAGISTTINVSVMIPAGTAAGTSDTATIIATSALSSTVSDGSNLTTTANQVANVDTSPNMTKSGVASTSVMYVVEVTNEGNGDDTFTLMVGNNSWPTTLSSASVGPLAAGQSMTVTASVEIPVSASTGMTDMAIITATSNTDNSVNDTTTLTTSATAAAPNVDLGPDMAKSGTEGTTISYMVPVTNTGNVMDTFTVTVAAGNSWSTSLNASTVGPLNPGDSGMATVSVMIPADTLSGTIDTATVVATSMFSPTVSDSSDLTTTASVIPMPNVELSADMAASGDPGNTVSYTVQVTNTGNVADTFAVTVAGNSWTTNVSPASVTLNAGASTTIAVSVMIAANASAGATDMATITATSGLNATVNDSANLTTTANQVANVDTSPNATQTGIASTTVMYVVEVTNEGNGDDTFTLMVGNNSWPTTLSSTSVGPLAAGQSMTVTASVMIPANASGGMTDMATITATSSFNGAVNDSTTLTTEAIAAAPNVETSPDMAKSGTVGTTISYMVPVTNTGNVVDTFTVTVAAGNSWSTSLDASSVGPLNPGQSQMAIVSVMIPADTLSGTIDTATIVATSMFSPTVSDSSDLRTTALVIPMPNVEVSPNMADSGDPGSTVNYSLQLTNTGNVADTFAVTVATGNSWTTTPSPASVTLNAGASTTINVSVMIPANASADETDTATIIATSVLSSTVSDGANLTTTANQVANVETSPDATQTGIASTTVTYPVQVTNTGNGDDTFTLMVGNNSWPTTLSSTSVGPLMTGQSMTVMASVQIPANASGGMTDMATITATSSFNGAVNDTTTLTTSAIAAAPGVETSPDMAKSGTEGTTISYMVPVTNTGNVVDTFTVTVAAGNSWSTTLDASSVGPLNPGQSQMAIVSVMIPADTLSGTIDTATIVATSMFSPTVSDSTNLATTASMIPMPNVDLSPDMADSGDPGSTVNYSLQLTNTGNVADTFAVTVATGNSWTTTPSSASVTLNARASTTINVSVMIPAGTAAGTSDTATIIATSGLSSTVSDGANLTTTANQVANVETSPDATQTGIASTTVMYPVQVTNTGNGDDTFTLTLGNNSWPTSLSSTSVGPLMTGQSMTVMASVQIPANASGGMTDMATITATSSFNGAVNDSTTLTTEAIAAAPGVDLSPDMAQSGLVGTTITYMVPVTNTGNVVDTFTVTISAGHTWTTTVSPSTVGPLNPGDSQMATVSVTVPSDAQESMTDTATIIATSMFSPTVSDSTNLTTTASEKVMLGVDIWPDMDSDSGDPGSTVDYTLQVANTGNVSDTFTVSVGGETWTTNVSPASVTLNAGASTTITASVMIPTDALSGTTDMATITATSALSPTVSDSANLTTTANQVAGVEISHDMPMTGTQGDIVSYMVAITNTGNGADTFDLAVSGETWTTNVSPDSVSLNADTSTMVTVTVEIPGDVDDGNSDMATVTATSQADSTVSDQAQLTTTATVSIEQDPDEDGVPDKVEDDAPNNGDGNNDGTDDSEQSNVTSLPNAGSGNDDGYVTLQSPAGTSLVDVSVMTVPMTISLPNEVTSFPQGIFNFKANGVSTETIVLTITLHADDSRVNSYWKQDGNGVWYDFAFSDTTGTGVTITHSMTQTFITLHLRDGAWGDADGVQNGTIVDPGAPGAGVPTNVSLANFDGQTAMPSRQAGLVLLVTLMAGAGLLALRRRQKGASTSS